MFECVWGVGVWMGVGRPCPLVRNNIVTPRHLFSRKANYKTCTVFPFDVTHSIHSLHGIVLIVYVTTFSLCGGVDLCVVALIVSSFFVLLNRLKFADIVFRSYVTLILRKWQRIFVMFGSLISSRRRTTITYANCFPTCWNGKIWKTITFLIGRERVSPRLWGKLWS